MRKFNIFLIKILFDGYIIDIKILFIDYIKLIKFCIYNNKKFVFNIL